MLKFALVTTPEKKLIKNNVEPRPPVVVVMGHIDHGKSTLLDYIQKTNIASQESGNITQHLGAYEVKHQTPEGEMRLITFLDTPGHQAFEAMRLRGALAADVAVLVVSAEEGVKTQTEEAWRSITAAKLQAIVAINKIDRPNANLERTKQSLAEKNILVEGYGGQIPVVAISAKTGEGIPELLDVILLSADLIAPTGDRREPASGFVLEARLDSKSGVSATLLIKNGTLLATDWLVIDSLATRAKKLESVTGAVIKSATFSSPIRVYGLSDLPTVGAPFKAVGNKKEAEALADSYKLQVASSKASLDPSHQSLDTSIELPVVIKADVAGTLEAVKKEVMSLATETVAPVIVSSGIGPIGENDVKILPQGLLIGFRVKADKPAEDLAERRGLTIKTFDVIYHLTEWLAEEIASRHPPTETIVGEVKVLKIFSQSKNKQVIGGSVETGVIGRKDKFRVERNKFAISQGLILDLEQTKRKVDKVEAGNQFGALVEAKIILAPGDHLIVSELK